MEAKPRRLDYYKTAEGKAPFTDWLDAQNGGVQGLVETRLKRVERGNFGDHHAEGGGVWALIFDIGQAIGFITAWRMIRLFYS